MSARCKRCELEYPTVGQLTSAGECPYPPPSGVLECRDRELALLRQKLAARPTREDFCCWWATLTNDERRDCWYDLDAMAHPEVVALLKQKLAASELENKAWRALARHSRPIETFPTRLVGDGVDISGWHIGIAGHSLSGKGDTPQAAAIALAEKLGLIDKAGG